MVATAAQAVNITIGVKFTTPAPPLVSSSPEVSTELVVLPDVSSSTGQAEMCLLTTSLRLP